MLGLDERGRLLRRGRRLEATTLGWNVAGIVALAIATAQAHSVALFGFGLDSVIEIGASIVVLWELADTAHDRRQRALRLIGWAFVALAAYLAGQSTVVLAVGYRSHHSLPRRLPLERRPRTQLAQARFCRGGRAGRSPERPTVRPTTASSAC